MTKCPWCNRKGRITLTVRSDGTHNLPVEGEVGRFGQSKAEKKPNELKAPEAHRLKDGKS
jgi:hypothetical protein